MLYNYFIVHCLGRCCRTYFLWWHGRCLSLACDISCWCYQVSYSGTTSYFVVISSDIISLSLVPLIWRVVWKKSLTLDLLSNSFSFVQRSKKQFARRILQSIRCHVGSLSMCPYKLSHIHPVEGQRKLHRVGGLKSQNVKLDGGESCDHSNQKSFCEGMDILWITHW